MKTTTRSKTVATVLLCILCVFTGCKKKAAPSADQILVHAPRDESIGCAPSFLKNSLLFRIPAEKPTEVHGNYGNRGEQLMENENPTEISALEREELVVVEAIIAAKAASILAEQSKNLNMAVGAMNLATERYKAGIDSQLEVRNARTLLTEAHDSYVDALRTYLAASITLIRDTSLAFNTEFLADP